VGKETILIEDQEESLRLNCKKNLFQGNKWSEDFGETKNLSGDNTKQ